VRPLDSILPGIGLPDGKVHSPHLEHLWRKADVRRPTAIPSIGRKPLNRFSEAILSTGCFPRPSLLL
jgi:hypothetical protein